MAKFVQLPEAVLDAITKKIGPKLETVTGSLGAGPGDVALFESTEVWMLEASQVVLPGINKIGMLAKPTGRWHHQIKNVAGDSPLAYARTKPLGVTAVSWAVVGVFGAGGIATKFDDAARWIDANVDGTIDYEVRLLEIPAYLMFAFWLVAPSPSDASLIVMITAPEGSDLAAERTYTESEFLVLLRNESFVQGLEFED